MLASRSCEKGLRGEDSVGAANLSSGQGATRRGRHSERRAWAVGRGCEEGRQEVVQSLMTHSRENNDVSWGEKRLFYPQAGLQSNFSDNNKTLQFGGGRS